MDIGFDITAARSKREHDDDSPSTVPMRAGISRADQRKPSSDQKKVRRLQTIKTAEAEALPDSLTEAEEIAPPLIQEPDAWTREEGATQGFEHPLTANKEMATMDPTGAAEYADLNQRESTLLRALSGRLPSNEARALAEELEVVRAQRRAVLAAHQDILLEDAFIAPATTPVVPFARTTAATDWLLDAPDATATVDYTQAMRAEASAWFERVHPAVKADREEFMEQARGMARHTAGQFGYDGAAAERAFLDTASFLQKRAENEGDGVLSGPVIKNQDGVHPEMQGAPGGGDAGKDPGSNQADQPSMVEDPPGINASRRVVAAKCSNCANGNHTGTNGTPGCSGGSCTCNCRTASRRQGSEWTGPDQDDYFGYDARCPACGQPIDYCQGHGPSGDPAGYAILEAHENGDHSMCNPEGCDEAAAVTARRKAFLGPQHGTLLSRAASMHLADVNPYPANDQAGYGETSLPTRDPSKDREVLDNFVPEAPQDGVHPDMPGAPGGGDQGKDPGSNQADQPSEVEEPPGINASLRAMAEKSGPCANGDHEECDGEGGRCTCECHDTDSANTFTSGLRNPIASRVAYHQTIDTLFQRIAAEENGQGESSLPNVEVGEEDDKPMWPWELDEEGKKKGEGAADVANVPTPGGERGWPQPTASQHVADGGRYAPTPEEPFRWLEPPVYSPEYRSYREVFPNGVPMRDEDLTPEQKAFLDAKRPMASLTPQQAAFRQRVQANLATRRA